MSEYSGALQAVQLTSTLWLIWVWPLLVAIVLFYRAWQQHGLDTAASTAERRFGHGALVLSLFAVLAHGVWLGSLADAARFLVSPGYDLARIGSLDLSVGLALDPLGAVVASAAIATGLLVLRADGTRATLRSLAGVDIAVAGTLFAATAADAVSLVVGWHVSALAVPLLLGSGDAQALRAAGSSFVCTRCAELLAVLSLCVMFWALGGSFSSSGEFTPDFRARLAGVRIAGSAGSGATRNTGTLTMLTLPGATVHLGAAELCEVNGAGERGGVGTASRPCRRIAYSPFVELPLPAALHEARVVVGPGSYELSIDMLRISPNQTTTLVNLGSTWNFREIADLLALRDAAGVPALRRDLFAKTLYGVGLIELSLALMIGAAALRSLQFQLWPEAAARASRVAVAVAMGLVAVTGGYSIVRLAPLFEWARYARYVLLAVGGAGAAFAAWRGFRTQSRAAKISERSRTAMAPAAACGFGLSLVALGAQMTSLGMSIALGSAVSSALWFTRRAASPPAAKAPIRDTADSRDKRKKRTRH